VPTLEDPGESEELLYELAARAESGAVLCGGDVDADWQRAAASGEEAVGGTVATPDQDVVDEIGHALGVEQAADAPVITSAEILSARDRHYWHLERRVAEEEDR
jgi:hypothetical protein